MAQGNIPVTELFWSLLDKADRKFSLLRDIPSYGRNRNDADFHKAFKLYTQLWKMQQEHRQKLVDAGLKRWEIGEIASRISQLYYCQYRRTSDASYLSESYIFYEAILSREYFGSGGGDGSVLAAPPDAANKQLRFLARFLIVCLVLGRREMVVRLAAQLRALVEECKRNFQEMEFKEWKHVVQEVVRFMKTDTPFMNMRPLRYSFIYDSHPDSLAHIASHSKRLMVLRDAILCSYRHNEVKFTELTIDIFRMLRCLEWEPCGAFALKDGVESGQNESGPDHFNIMQDIKDPSLPPNPHKVILYRPFITHFFTVLATICEELPSDGILLVYLSASGKDLPRHHPFPLGLDRSPNANDEIVENSDRPEIYSPLNASCDDLSQLSLQSESQNQQTCLWLGSHGSEGSSCLYPCDLIPFTRKPLFLIIDSNNSHAFKTIHGSEKGETIAMLLSAPSQPPDVAYVADSSGYQESLFTMFITAPVQAFCCFIGNSGVIDKSLYNDAERLLSLALCDWETALLSSDSLHFVWLQALADPFLRRILLRFIFCRAVLKLHTTTAGVTEFQPSCLPHLPDSVLPEEPVSRSAVMQLAEIFGATEQFLFSRGIPDTSSQAAGADFHSSEVSDASGS